MVLAVEPCPDLGGAHGEVQLELPPPLSPVLALALHNKAEFVLLAGLAGEDGDVDRIRPPLVGGVAANVELRPGLDVRLGVPKVLDEAVGEDLNRVLLLRGLPHRETGDEVEGIPIGRPFSLEDGGRSGHS